MTEDSKPVSQATRFGAIGVFGRANAGKSTLVNALVGERVSIVSNRPQTTRRRVLGILTRGPDQFVFCDTPGLHAIKNQLDAFMAAEIEATLSGLQGAMYLVDATDASPEEDVRYLSQLLQQMDCPVVLVINKIDKIRDKKAEVIARLEESYVAMAPFAAMFPVSAGERKGLKPLQEHLNTWLLPGPHGFAPDFYTSQTEREIVEEIIREEILHRYFHEVPHSVAVVIEEFTEKENGKTFIAADLYLEKDSHKKILIGAGGKGIKDLGTAARKRLGDQLGRDIFLQLWVKIRPNWRRDEQWVRRMGYVKR